MASAKTANKVGRPQGRRPKQTREAILNGARSCFVEKGYGATTFKEVATRAGLTPAALYTHFDSKLDLYLSTLEYSIIPILPGFKTALETDTTFKDKLRAILELAIDLYESNQDTLTFILEAHLEARRHPEIASYENRDHYQMATSLLRDVFHQAIERGEVPGNYSVDDLLLMFIGGTMGMASFASLEGIRDKTSLRAGVGVLLSLIK